MNLPVRTAVAFVAALYFCGRIHLCGGYTDPVLSPTEVTDQHKNHADSDSSITWASLPDGIPYVTNSSVDDGAAGPYLDMMRGFTKILQPKDVDYELVSGLIKGETDLATGAKSMGTFVAGYGLCVVIGILFLVFFPLVGCCFCCCRVCGKCGGKRLQKEPIKDCKCIVFTVFSDLFVIGIFMSAMLTIIMDDRMSYSLNYMTTATESNMEDVNSFLENTVNEVNFVAVDGFNFTRAVLLRDLNNVGSILGVPVRDRLDNNLGINTTIQEIIAMDDKIDSVTSAMEQLNWAIGNFTDAYTALDTALSTLQSDLTTTLAETPCTDVTVCDDLDAGQLMVNPAADPSLVPQPGIHSRSSAFLNKYKQIPSLSSSLAELYDLQNQDITGSALDGKKSFDELPWQVQNDTKAQIIEIESQLDSFSADIKENIGAISALSNNSAGLTGAKSSIEGFTGLVDEYDAYRSAGFYAIALVLMVMVLLFVLGLCIGPCCYNGQTKPTERKCCSNCAGIFLMAAAGVSWILSILLMVFTLLPFLIGYPLEKFMCDPLTDPEYKIFQHLLDGPNGMLSEGYFMGELLFGNGSIDLTLSGVLESCRNNEAAYEAMKLENLIDLDQVTNYQDSINMTEEINKMTSDMSTVELISQDTIDQLNQFSSATQIDYDAMYMVLGLPLTLTDLQQFHTDLVAAIPSVDAESTKNDLTTHAATLQGIINSEYTTASNWQTDVNDKTENLEAVAGTIPDQVNTTIEATETLETNIQTGYGDQILNEEITTYSNRIIGIIDGFVDFTLDKFTNDLGRCEPFWNVWESLIVVGMCSNLIDTFNGFWFSLGLGVFSSFFAIIFSIKLAKYYRTMKHLDGEEEEGEEGEGPENEDEDGQEATNNGYYNQNYLAEKGNGPPPPFVSSQPYAPQQGGIGKAGSAMSPPPSYGDLHSGNKMDF